ncbi:lymphocyte antigen 96 isoform X1 [Protobothrops mucrosquamatus]|uniref:lymphocyte antigen 96 isoform X1 n=1 Tax=Protobothrops mucrosquamatus TaxID=103944 RepID=UPI0007759255|nr:lymphocyte antigen 96 isoform X1 [Protobothrops mucrosquamatus]
MVLRYLHIFQLVIILFVYGFTVALEKQLLCTSHDIDILYSYCGSGRDTFFFSVEPCLLRDRTEWQGTIFWIPKADLTVVDARIQLWNGPLKALKWESTVCHGVDDDYSYCGTLKGETIKTTVKIRDSHSQYRKLLKGEYIASLEVFTGLKELVTCVNYTLILK